jgi:hypothetical protein
MQEDSPDIIPRMRSLLKTRIDVDCQDTAKCSTAVSDALRTASVGTRKISRRTSNFQPSARTNHRSIDRYAHHAAHIQSHDGVLIRLTEICKNGHQAQPADPEEPLPQGLVCDTAFPLRKFVLTFTGNATSACTSTR